MGGRDWIQLLGPTVTFFGIALSVLGTFLLTKWYYPFGAADFFKALFTITGLVLTGRRKKAVRLIKTIAKFGEELREERRADSIIGVCLIFVGFIFQAVGACFWGADMIWGILTKSCH